MNRITDMDTASIGMAEDYMITPHLVKIAYVGHIHKLLDRLNLKEITFEDFCNYMAISAIVANKSVILANDQRSPIAL